LLFLPARPVAPPDGAHFPAVLAAGDATTPVRRRARGRRRQRGSLEAGVAL